MPSVYRQKNNIVHAIRGCAKSAAPDVLYAARIDVYISCTIFKKIPCFRPIKAGGSLTDCQPGVNTPGWNRQFDRATPTP